MEEETVKNEVDEAYQGGDFDNVEGDEEEWI